MAIRRFFLIALPVVTLVIVLVSDRLERSYQESRNSDWLTYNCNACWPLDDINDGQSMIIMDDNTINVAGKTNIVINELTDPDFSSCGIDIVFEDGNKLSLIGEDTVFAWNFIPTQLTQEANLNNKTYPGNIRIDSLGRLWFTVYDRNLEEYYLFQYDGQNWTINALSDLVISGYKLGYLGISDFKLDKYNHLWFGAQVFDGAAWISDPEDSSDYAEKRVWDFDLDSKGQLWLVTDDDVMMFNGDEWITYTEDNSGFLAGYGSSCTYCNNELIEIDKDDRVWVANKYRGLSVFNGETWINYSAENSGLAGRSISDIAFDQQNRVWIGYGYDGISVFDGEDWLNLNEYNSGLAERQIEHITFDDNNRALIISSSSIGSYCIESVNISRTPVDQIEPLPNTSVYLRNTIYSSESIWFIAFALLSIWIGLLFQSLPGVLIGLSPFVLTLLGSGAVRYPAHSGSELYPGIIIGTAGGIGGIIGAGLGLLIDWIKSDGEKPIFRSRQRLSLGIIFAIIGMVIGLFFVFLQIMSH